MGKRKSTSSRAKLQLKKKIPKLDSVFGCPFCGHISSVKCTIEKKSNFGVAACYVCDERYHTKITPLTEPIDIFTEWIDECEHVNQDQEA